MTAAAPLRIQVDLGDRSYPIHIGAGLLERTGELVKPHLQSGHVLVIADQTVAARHGERLVRALTQGGITAEVATFPAGESSKNLRTAEDLWQACARHRIDRSDAIIAFGGGVSGDLAGFVAAAWMRGIRFVQIPTTLLAMVDSSVGGKTGVNSAAGKNLIGAFKQPECVVIDPQLLQSMDAREYRAGLAEVLKYGVIHDADFLSWQEVHADALEQGQSDAVAHAVAESCRIKAWYVGEDETEQGVRAELNYGHTFAHALERHTAYTQYLHGEAVGIGMRMAAALAQELGELTDASLPGRQDALLRRYRLPLVHPVADLTSSAVQLTELCQLDKKVAQGHLRFIVPHASGQVRVRTLADRTLVQRAFAHGLVQGGGAVGVS